MKRVFLGRFALLLELRLLRLTVRRVFRVTKVIFMIHCFRLCVCVCVCVCFFFFCRVDVFFVFRELRIAKKAGRRVRSCGVICCTLGFARPHP